MKFSTPMNLLLAGALSINASPIEGDANLAARQSTTDQLCGAQIAPTNSETSIGAHIEVKVPVTKPGAGSGPNWPMRILAGYSGTGPATSTTFFNAGLSLGYNNGKSFYNYFYQAFPEQAITILPNSGTTAVSAGDNLLIQVAYNSATQAAVLIRNESKNLTYFQIVNFPAARKISKIGLAYFDIQQIQGTNLPNYGNLQITNAYSATDSTDQNAVLYPGAANGGAKTTTQQITLNGHQYCAGKIVNTQGTIAVNYKP